MSAVLIISPEPWDGLFVSKHHYAIELARRGHSVFFFGPPTETNELEVEYAKWHGLQIGVVNSPPVLPGIRYLPPPMRNRFEARWLKNLEHKTNQRVDVVWLFENSRFFDLRFAGERLKIYQQVDIDQDFQPMIAARTSDLTIAISRPISRLLVAEANKLIRVTHGYSAMATTPLPESELEQRFSDFCSNAVFTGNLDRTYLDVPLLADLVKGYPETRFHFVGNYTEGRHLHGAVAGLENVLFWGRRPAEKLPSILKRADILLVASLADEHLEQLANPHKIMEYLASGKVILATRTLEYEDTPDLVCTANNRAEFLDRFREIIGNLEHWNAPERMETRRAFAADNTYAHQVDRIAAALGERGSLIS
ncbi:MAG: glycosyltransferase [Pseudomonadota bacterium]